MHLREGRSQRKFYTANRFLTVRKFKWKAWIEKTEVGKMQRTIVIAKRWIKRGSEKLWEKL